MTHSSPLTGKARWQALLSILLVIVSTVGSAVIMEAAYRIYWISKYGPPPDDLEIPMLGVYDVSHWEFDERFGYIYPPGRKINLTSIAGGKVVGCGILDAVNELGNIGPIIGKYEEADFKIAVFGDSFTAFHVNGKTWPAFLQETLEKKLNRKVHVLNFGRDGYGILQMATLAAHELPKWKPDLAIIAFITDDITRDRFWRMTARVDGELRILTTKSPKQPPDISEAADTFLVHEGATHDWCRATEQKRDQIVEEIEDRYRRYVLSIQKSDQVIVNGYTLRHSFIYNRVVHGDPVYFARRKFTPAQNPRLKYTDYAQAPGFSENIKTINATGIPVIWVHLPIYTEVKANKEYELVGTMPDLLASLERDTQSKVEGLLSYTPLPVERPDRMNITETNYHPSLWGMEFYTQAVVKMLDQRGALPQPKSE